jgi:prolyl-tRNA synthetase
MLTNSGIEVLFDDREVSAGQKFADSDLIGIPYRMVVSEKSLAAGGVEVKKRDEAKSEIVGIEALAVRFD